MQQQTAKYRVRVPAGKEVQQDHPETQAKHKAGCQKIEKAKAGQQPEDKGFARPAASPEGFPLVGQERQDHGSTVNF
jgi:hypothetical protein